jgi:hypothetical protein
MHGSESRTSSALDQYLDRLDSALTGVPPHERNDILREMRSHVIERTRRAPFPDVEQVLSELGPPAAYARQFLPETELVPTTSRAVLPQVAQLVGGGWRTLPLLLVVLTSYAVGIVAFAIALWKLIEPDGTGLWINELGSGRRSISLMISDPRQEGREVLGYWLVPIGMGIAVLVHLGMSALLKRVSLDGGRQG